MTAPTVGRCLRRDETGATFEAVLEGRVIGYISRPARTAERPNPVWSLTTDNGIDLLRVGIDMADALVILAEHHAWRVG